MTVITLRRTAIGALAWALLAAVAGAAAAQPASAATISQTLRPEGGACGSEPPCELVRTTTLEAAPGARDGVRVALDRSQDVQTVRFRALPDSPALTAGSGCTLAADGSVGCLFASNAPETGEPNAPPPPTIEHGRLRVDLGDGDDRLEIVDPSGLGLESLGDEEARFDGGEGDDRLDGFGFLRGGPGNDRLHTAHDADHLQGGDGNDRLSGGAGDDQLQGGDGHDVLLGGELGDDLRGGAGNDRLSGGTGFDSLHGNDGDDELSGGRKPDRLWGGDDDDTLDGRRSDDGLSGGSGDDRLHGGRGADRLNGGPGADTARPDAHDRVWSIERLL